MIKSIDWEVMSNGRGDEPLWFHPRACRVPAASDEGSPSSRRRTRRTPQVFMTAQGISGSDYFHPVHWMVTDDLGASWSKPEAVPGFGRREVPGTDMQIGVCDVVPEYHRPTGTVLCIGHSVFYRDGAFFLPQPDRHPVYAVYSPSDGTWRDGRRLEWDRAADLEIYTTGCGQRHTLGNGDILLALSFRPHGEEASRVTSVIMSFDGVECRIRETGSTLELPVKRGLLEPTLVEWNGRYYLSMRAEDGHGYHAVSDDGLTWRDFGPWCWDDGEPLTMSTTQSRWLPHSESLYLVYTRRDETNVNVMRWRAPLFVARVDPTTMRLERRSEQVAVPLRGDGVNDPDHVARLGNHHTVAVTEGESWVTVGEAIPKEGWKGDTIVSRITWSTPNLRLGSGAGR